MGRAALVLGLMLTTLVACPGLAVRASQPGDLPEAGPVHAQFVADIELGCRRRWHRPHRPAGVAVAADGTGYVIDALSDTIVLFARDGSLMGTWGGHGTDPGQFQFLGDFGSAWGDLAFGPDGDLYVLDPFNSRVQVFGPDGAFMREWGTSGAAAGQFAVPTGIAVDVSNRVYVTDAGNARLQRFAHDGQFLAAWEPPRTDDGPPPDLGDVVVDATGMVSVTDTAAGHLYRFAADGEAGEAFGATTVELGPLVAPWGIAVDGEGSLYVAESRANRVQVFSAGGARRGTIPGFATPTYLSVGPDGLLYVAEDGACRIQVLRLLPPLMAVTAAPSLDGAPA